MPGMTHWQHPRFFAYFPANSSPPSVIAEYLTATLAAQCMLWQTSPAATELETRMLDWLRQMIGLPRRLLGRDPGFGLERDARRHPHRPRTRARLGRQRRRACRAIAVAGLLLGALPFLDRQGLRIAGIGQDNLVQLPARARSSAWTRRRSTAPIHADRAADAAGRDRRLPRRHERRRLRRHRRRLRGRAPPWPLSARRCRLGRQRHDLPGVPPPDARRGRRRQLRLQPAQMAVHQFRLLGAFHPRPGSR